MSFFVDTKSKCFDITDRVFTVQRSLALHRPIGY